MTPLGMQTPNPNMGASQNARRPRPDGCLSVDGTGSVFETALRERDGWVQAAASRSRSAAEADAQAVFELGQVGAEARRRRQVGGAPFSRLEGSAVFSSPSRRGASFEAGVGSRRYVRCPEGLEPHSPSGVRPMTGRTASALIDDPCIVSGRKPSRGYVYIRVHGRLRLEHRHVYEECFGFLPPWIVVHHRCGNKICINPNHLQALTRAAHMLVHDNLGALTRQRPSHCKRGHEFTTDNTYVDPGTGRRKCRTCARAREQRRQQSKQLGRPRMSSWTSRGDGPEVIVPMEETGKYIIVFDLPDMDPLYAGRVARDNSLGWAFAIDTAMRFKSEEDAERMLKNGYGNLGRKYGSVCELGLVES